LPTMMLKPGELYRLARLGAMARVRELDAEAAAIRKLFPGLGKPAPAAADAAAPAAAHTVRRRRWKMSAEARKAASARMTAYWAAKRQKAESRQASVEATPANPAGAHPRKTKARRKKKARARKKAAGKK